MDFAPAKIGRAVKPFTLGLALWCLAGVALALSSGPRYSGRVLYRGTKAPVPGVLVEVVEAEDNGEPTDEVLGSTHADAEGRFAVVLTERTDKPVALVVSAVRTSASSGGDRSTEGYDIKTHQTRLAFLPHPSPTKPNTRLRRTPQAGAFRQRLDLWASLPLKSCFPILDWTTSSRWRLMPWPTRVRVSLHPAACANQLHWKR